MIGTRRKIINFEPGELHGFMGWYTRLECGHLRFVMRTTAVSLPTHAECNMCAINSMIESTSDNGRKAGENASGNNDNLSTMSTATSENGGDKQTSNRTLRKTKKGRTFSSDNNEDKKTVKVISQTS